MLLCCSLLSWAQTTVTGIVFDETNLEVIGANVKEKGTTNGAITNLDGAFSFQVSDTHFAATWLLDERAPKVTPPSPILKRWEKWSKIYISRCKIYYR